jgi:hypothetical protein
MRDFFLNLLNNLDKLAGLKQLDKIYAIHGDDTGSAKKEINMLLDVLCRVSSQFPFIPEHEQEKIITQAVISKDFPNLNANVVWHWLNEHKDKYFKESHHVPKEQVAEPLTGEARAKWLAEWNKSLANTEQMIVSNKMSRAEIAEEGKQHGKEWASEIERKAVSTQFDPERKPYTIEDIKSRNTKIRSMQEQTFRSRNPEASEEEVNLFLMSMEKYLIPVPETKV